MTVSIGAIAAGVLAYFCLGRSFRALDLFLETDPPDAACAAATTAVGFAALAGMLAGACLVMAALSGAAA